MKLSPHFTLEEFTLSQTAERIGLDNLPPAGVMDHLYYTAANLEEVRTILNNKPLLISSGYRCPELNKLVDGAPNSDHIQGFAADFICPEYGPPLMICQRLQLFPGFSKLIYEYSWVHMSFNRTTDNHEQLVLTKRRGMDGYLPGLVA